MLQSKDIAGALVDSIKAITQAVSHQLLVEEPFIFITDAIKMKVERLEYHRLSQLHYTRPGGAKIRLPFLGIENIMETRDNGTFVLEVKTNFSFAFELP